MGPACTRSLLWVLLLQQAAAACSDTQHSRPLRVLAVPLLPTSPTMDMMAVVAELKARGHQVLVIGSDSAMPFIKQSAAQHSSNTTAEALSYLSVNLTAALQGKRHVGRAVEPGRVTQTRFRVPRFPRSLTAGLELELVIQDGVAEPCAALLEDSSILKAMRDFRPDVVTAIGMPVPDTSTDSCGCLLSHALDVPLVDIDCGMTFWSGPPSTPQFGSGLQPADLNTVLGYTQNLIAWAIKQAAMPALTGLMATPWSAVRDRLGLPRTATNCPVVDGLVRLTGKAVRRCDVLLNVIMGSWLLEHPRPLAPNQLLLGPGTPHPPRALEQQQVSEFLEGAASGLVLVAFGTSFQFNSWLSLKDFEELSAAFASLAPVRVLWHINVQALPREVTVDKLHLGNNTLLVPRVDYNDVLGHPHTNVFVSHCGIHSVYEAMFHGVPVVGVPFMFEQAESGSRLASTGAAVMCRQASAYRMTTAVTAGAAGGHYTREHVAGLIHQVLNNSSYAQATRQLSLVLQTQAQRRRRYAAAADEVERALLARLVQSGRLVRQDRAAGVSEVDGGHKQQVDGEEAEMAAAAAGTGDAATGRMQNTAPDLTEL